MSAPASFSASTQPVRVGFKPTSTISTSEPGSAAAAQAQKAAEEMSPGTSSRCRSTVGRCGPSTLIRVPSFSNLIPKVLNARSV